MSNLLIVSNCPSENCRLLQQSVYKGAAKVEFAHSVRCLEAGDAGPQDVLWAEGVVIGTTENFGYMSGLVKDFFERIYYPCLEQTEGKPYGLYVKGGLDGEGARTSVERIIAGLKWKAIAPALVLKGEMQPEFTDQCEQLGMLMAAGLDGGIF